MHLVYGHWRLPDYVHLANGVSDADSWAMDGHKWLNVPYDSGIAIIRDRNSLAQAMSINGSYLLGSESRDAIDFNAGKARGVPAQSISGRRLNRSGAADWQNWWPATAGKQNGLPRACKKAVSKY